MPELPEVEIFARTLDQHLAGRTIIKASVTRPSLVAGSTPVVFARKLKGALIQRVRRRAKFILIDLHEPALVLLTHLRMTGNFLLADATDDHPKHTHAVFLLDDGRCLLFEDQRQFGRMRLVPVVALARAKELRALAPEPLTDEFSLAYLTNVLQNSRREIKTLLLDQTKVVGLGNIYAAEALYSAGINPFTPSANIGARRILRLHSAIKAVLQVAIDHGARVDVDAGNIGASYFDGVEDRGWCVYDREGQSCMKCKRSILRLVQAQRSTYFCPGCQRA